MGSGFADMVLTGGFAGAAALRDRNTLITASMSALVMTKDNCFFMSDYTSICYSYAAVLDVVRAVIEVCIALNS